MPFPRGTSKVGRFLWAARRATRGWSLAELSGRSGVNRGDLSRYENGRLSPTTKVFEKVMAAFEAADMVLDGSVDQEPRVAAGPEGAAEFGTGSDGEYGPPPAVDSAIQTSTTTIA